MKLTTEELISEFKATNNEMVAMVDKLVELHNRIADLEAAKTRPSAQKSKKDAT